jgi:broad specificity phosphatase PhoE
MSAVHFSTVTDFYAFRHAETHRNCKGEEIQGWIDDSDAQLSQAGIDGAHQLGKGLVQHVPDAVAIYSSDITRSYNTAKIVADYYETKLPVYKDEKLREKCHGKWDTMSYKKRNEYCLKYYETHREELQVNNDRFAKWKVEPLSLGEVEPKLPDCQDPLESIYDVYLRASSLFTELGEKYPGEKVLISSHGAVNDIMATEAESRQIADNCLLPVYFEPKARHFPKNCAVYHFTWDSSKQELNFSGEKSL